MILSPCRCRFLSSVAMVALVAAPAVAFAQRKDDKKQQEAQRQEIQALVKLVDAAMTGPASADFPIQWQNDFLKAQEGHTYVPFTLSIEATKLPPQPIAMYVRVAPKGATQPAPAADPKKKDDKKKDEKGPSAYPFEDVHFLELKAPPPGQSAYRVSRAFAVPGGEYDVYVSIKERAAGGKEPPAAKTAVFKQPLAVPDYWNSELAASTVMVADRVDQVAQPYGPEEQSAHPYAMGVAEIVPAVDNRFRKDEELLLLFQIYNTALTTEGKPDVEIEYNFHQKTADGEKYFNKTPPQQINAQTIAPQTDFRAGNPVQAGQGVPLATFPEGEFRLEIKITDKIAGKSLKRDVSFAIVGS